LSIEDALAYLGRFLNHHDFSQYDLDAPFPELGDIGKNAFRFTSGRIKKIAKEKNLSLREVALSVSTSREGFIGTGAEVAEKIIRRIDEGAADGFILGFAVVAEELDDFVRLVVQELERRGRYSRDLPGRTLLDHLDLPRKESRYKAPPVAPLAQNRA
jgi:alkanesulfonate monooxygenase SsuD/methylene tetrahydromethanopterin reductase-like flavin-dependent oxidoreductase (luciferase family)